MTGPELQALFTRILGLDRPLTAQDQLQLLAQLKTAVEKLGA